jgi:hypothetical protein
VQSTTGPGQIILDDEAGSGTALNGNGGTVSLSAGTGGIQTTLFASGLPLSTDGFAIAGGPLNLALGFAPTPGMELTIVDDDAAPAASNPIGGVFANLAQGGLLTLSYQGTSYQFQANYDGGDGNDLVLTALAGASPQPPESPQPSAVSPLVALELLFSPASASIPAGPLGIAQTAFPVPDMLMSHTSSSPVPVFLPSNGRQWAMEAGGGGFPAPVVGSVAGRDFSTTEETTHSDGTTSFIKGAAFDIVLVHFQTLAPEVQIAELSDAKPDPPDLPEMMSTAAERLLPPKAPLASPDAWWSDYAVVGSGIALAGSLLVLLVPTFLRRKRSANREIIVPIPREPATEPEPGNLSESQI